MAGRLNVVVSQGQSAHPQKRGLEESLVAALLGESGVDVTVVPHLYDLAPDGSGVLALESMQGDIVVVSWLYSRAAHWVLGQQGVRGRMGTTLLSAEAEEEAEQEFDGEGGEETAAADGNGEVAADIPNRTIFHLDFRSSQQADDFLTEIRRIRAESSVETVDLLGWIGGSPKPEQMQRYMDAGGNGHKQPLAPGDAAAADNGNGADGENGNGADAGANLFKVDETPGRRWYPVIDYARCTNCMECIDFCLFGVYGVDTVEQILVEQPDNCRKGCPACSRVCPENAIIFPQHKSPAIAGSPVEEAGALKIDLSKLFGGGALETAVSERDQELVAAGRDAVGMTVGIPKRQTDRPAEENDELDDLMDELDDSDL